MNCLLLFLPLLSLAAPSPSFSTSRFPTSIDSPSHCFQCKFGGCIDYSLKCNGPWDCPSGDDEDDCPLTEMASTGRHDLCSDGFMCNDRLACIPKRWRCDREKDCADGSDEDGCEGSGWEGEDESIVKESTTPMDESALTETSPPTLSTTVIPVADLISAPSLISRLMGDAHDFGGMVQSINTTDDSISVRLGVKEYKLEDLKVTVIDNALIIEANHGEREDSVGSIERHFIRKIALPNGVHPASLTATLMANGSLSIETFSSSPNEPLSIPIKMQSVGEMIN